MHILQRLKSGLLNTLAATFLIALIGLCSGIVLARTLGPTHRGEFAAVLLWPGVIALLGEMGLGFAFSYHAGKNQGSVNGLWTLSWGISLVWGGVLMLGGIVILPSVLDLAPAVMTSLKLCMVAVPLQLATGYQIYILLGAGLIHYFNFVRVLGVLSYLVGIVVVTAFGKAGIMNFTIVYIVSLGLVCLLATGLVIWKLCPSLRWQTELIRPVMKYGLKTHISSISAQANLRLDQLLMTIMVSSEQLGLYVIAVAISGMINPLYNALSIVVLPRVIRAGNRVEERRQVKRHVQLGMIIGIPLAAIGVVVMPWLLPLFFGEAYSLAIIPAQILIIAAIFQGMNIVLGNSLRGLGHPGKTAIAESIGLFVTFGLLLVLLPRLGVLGAAITSLVAYVLVMLTQTAFVMRATGLTFRDFLVVYWQSKSFL